MPSEQYWEGRLLENNQLLHEQLIKHLSFDSITVDGSTGTKGDTIGIQGGQRIPISIKNASGANTQCHLTTLRQLAQGLAMPEDLYPTFDRWLGTNDAPKFAQWTQGLTVSRYEQSHGRLCSGNLPDWDQCEAWVNQVNKSLALPKLLLQQLKEENPAQWLVWVRKKKGGFQIVDVNKLVSWIGTSCEWITMPAGTVLRCITPTGKPILWWQMKGNREPNGYNHTAQFHLVENWPQEFVVYEDRDIRF